VISVTLNGERHELPRAATVNAAVRASGVAEAARGVAVAVDGEVVPRGAWNSTRLEEGQKVEVAYFGRRHGATVAEEPLFDPAMKRMRG